MTLRLNEQFAAMQRYGNLCFSISKNGDLFRKHGQWTLFLRLQERFYTAYTTFSGAPRDLPSVYTSEDLVHALDVALEVVRRRDPSHYLSLTNQEPEGNPTSPLETRWGELTPTYSPYGQTWARDFNESLQLRVTREVALNRWIVEIHDQNEMLEYSLWDSELDAALDTMETNLRSQAAILDLLGLNEEGEEPDTGHGAWWDRLSSGVVRTHDD